MTAGHELRVDQGVFEDALVFFAVPASGLVGTIAAQFLVDRLGLKEVGHVTGAAVPPGVVVRPRGVGRPMAVHGGPHLCGPGASCRNVVVVSADAPVVPEHAAELAAFLVRTVAAQGAYAVVLLDAWQRRGRGEERGVFAVAAGPDAGVLVQAAGATALATGTIAGFTGAALQEGLDRGCNVLALFTPADAGQADAAAAARLLGSLVHLAAVQLDTTPLEEHSRRVEVEVRSRREPVGGPMYA